jgi:hypothetical protein
MQDSNSIWADPNFIDSTNLHILNSPAQNAGKPISTVSNDIDGDLRSPVSPDIGADEYSPNQYHVSVDMRLENINPNGVHIVGNFQGWNTDSTLMEDSDGDGIYTYTIDTYFGDTVMYRFINGDEWSNAEVVPIGCQFLGSSNRGKISNFDIDSAEVVCFSACISCNVGISEQHSERELENSLVNNIRNFLLEMGHQFTFVGNQFRLEVEGKEYFIDLLLYQRQLQCLVAIELKVGEFLPEYKGKMEFYLSVLNDKIKLPRENDSIGIIICKEKNRTVVEYSLKTSQMPIGVATYTLTNKLPKAYKDLLPSSKEITDKIEKYFG